MNMEFEQYPKTRHLDRAPEVAQARRVTITEKIHGTSFRVQYELHPSDGITRRYGSRNRELDEKTAQEFYGGRPVSMLASAVRSTDVAFVMRMMGATGDDSCRLTLYGEFYGDGVQRGARYCNGHGFVGYAAACDGVRMSTIASKCVFDELGLSFVPILHNGPMPDVPTLQSMATGDSVLATNNAIFGQRREGIVITSHHFVPNGHGEYPVAKLKSPEFSESRGEKNGSDSIDQLLAKNAAVAIARLFATRGRVFNVWGHLADEDETKQGRRPKVQDLGVLIKAVSADIKSEHETEWREALEYGASERQLNGAIAKYVRAIVQEGV